MFVSQSCVIEIATRVGPIDAREVFHVPLSASVYLFKLCNIPHRPACVLCYDKVKLSAAFAFRQYSRELRICFEYCENENSFYFSFRQSRSIIKLIFRQRVEREKERMEVCAQNAILTSRN